jgi:general stress protein 26
MPTPQELEAKCWDALAADRTMMLGIDGAEDGHTRPMTAHVEDRHSPIWFFTTKDNALVQKLAAKQRAIATFASKSHDLFATVHGSLHIDNDPAAIDRLWDRHVAAWYDGGKTDPRLALLRLAPERAEIWQHQSSAFTGIKVLFGSDPKKDIAEKAAQVRLG